MSIHVSSHADSLGRTFPDASVWHVDGDGYLHILKDTESIAVFRPVSWDSVERIETVATTAESDSKEPAGTEAKDAKEETPAK
jgi:hypothetical protein